MGRILASIHSKHSPSLIASLREGVGGNGGSGRNEDGTAQASSTGLDGERGGRNGGDAENTSVSLGHATYSMTECG